MNRKSMMMIAVMTALSASAAWAAAPTSTDAAPRQRLDANADGVVDKAEAAKSPWLAQQFDALDKNHDGKLSADERPQRHGHRKGGRGGHDGPHAAMAKLDSNHDGKLSRAEANAEPRMAARFDNMDANGDGFVDRSDRELAKQQRRDQWFTDADSDKDGKLTRAEVAAADAKRDSQRGDHFQAGMQQRMEASDTNKDGRLSRDEVKDNPRLAKRFDQMDADKDGYLGKDELQRKRMQR